MSQPAKKQTFLHGAALLAMATAIVKLIGALYKIPLQRVIGDDGFGYFSTAYEIYTVLLLISTTGLPVAMSRLISRANSLGHYRQVRKVYTTSRTIFLLLGNAMELFGQYIQREDGSKVEGLGVFNTHTIRHAPNRFNTLIQGTFENMTLLGYTSRFADTFGITEENAFCHVEIGSGSDPKTKLEGIHSGRVIASYLLGPLLVANPDFSKWLLKQLGVTTDSA